MRHFLCILMLIFSFVSGASAKSEWEKIRASFNEAMGKDGGTSAFVETEFGEIRLISCRTGIKNLSGLAAGVDVALKPGWIIRKINIEPSEEYAKANVLPVFKEDSGVNQSWTENYQQSTIFPIWLYEMNNQDIPLTILTEIEACSTETRKCLQTQQFLNLPLSAGEAYPTLTCGAITHALKNAAVDITRTNVKAENQLLPNGDLKVRLIFPKDVQTIDIQSLDVLMKSTFKKIDQFVYTGIFHPEYLLKNGDKIPLNIRSSNGCYTWDLIVSGGELDPVSMPLPFGFGFWSGILFFFLSPLWCAWMMPNKITDDERIFRKKIRLLQLYSVIGIWGLGGLWMIGLYPFGWIQNPFFAGTILIGLAALIIKPVPKRLWVIGGLVFILPKPFGGILSDVGLSTKVYLLIWWTICAYIPFNIWLLMPKVILKFFEDVQKQDIPAYGTIVRLPYIILLGWLGVSLIGYHHYKVDPIFQPDETKGAAIVQVLNPVCLTCVKDRMFFLSHFKDHLYRINADSEWAQEKKKLYQVTSDTFYIYIKPNGQEILLPQNLSRNKLSNALSN